MCFTFSKHRRYKSKMSFVESKSSSENLRHRNLSSNILVTCRSFAQVQQPIWQLVFEYATSKHPKKQSGIYWLIINTNISVHFNKQVVATDQTHPSRNEESSTEKHMIFDHLPHSIWAPDSSRHERLHWINPAWLERREAVALEFGRSSFTHFKKPHIVCFPALLPWKTGQ